MKKMMLVLVVALVATACAPAAPAAKTATGPKANPTVGDIASQPGLYVGQKVTLTGVVARFVRVEVDQKLRDDGMYDRTERAIWAFTADGNGIEVVQVENRVVQALDAAVSKPTQPGLTTDTIMTLTGTWTAHEGGWYLVIK